MVAESEFLTAMLLVVLFAEAAAALVAEISRTAVEWVLE